MACEIYISNVCYVSCLLGERILLNLFSIRPLVDTCLHTLRSKSK